jgi:integrase
MTDTIVFDGAIPGFGLRTRAGGSQTWVFQYKLGAKQRRMVIGKASALTPAKARKIAGDLYAAVRLGRDPASERETAKVQAAETFKAVAEQFLERQKERLRPTYHSDVERHLLVYAKTLHGISLAKVTKRDIATCLTSVEKNSGAASHNRVRASLSTLFAWAMSRGLAEINPVIGTERIKEHSRERVLDPAELRAIWNACLEDDYGAIIKLLALTGQRAGEIAELRWSEVRDEQIVLPGERTKNHRLHIVPLSAAAQAILDALPRRIGRDLVFGSRNGAFAGWSSAKYRFDARIAEAGKPLAHWTPHDLRRTAATGMADLGVQPHVIEAVLNHVSGHKGGVAGIYNRATYDKEKREALSLWAEHLMAIVEGRAATVVPLKRA